MGRPREFDREQALGKAMDAFWTKGYEGTSVQDLVDTMGIHRASLYDTFGSKRDLFMEVIERYSAHVLSTVFSPLSSEAGVRERMTSFFLTIAERACSESGQGCLVVKTMVTHGDELPGAREKCLNHTASIEELFQAVLEAGQATGEIDEDADVADLAKDLRNTLFGLWVSAAVVGDLEDLRGIARRAILALPKARVRA
jgi:TetR/AcrR family transcriptional repressor of nem operon